MRKAAPKLTRATASPAAIASVKIVSGGGGGGLD